VKDNISRFLAQAYCSVDTDAVAKRGHPHPRLHGTSPRVLGRFVGELDMVSLPDAIPKMTSHGAKIVGWGARLGHIRPGLATDLVLFDPAVADRATNDQPRQPPPGIEGAWVAGRQVVERGRLVDDLVAGEV
jgi:N-acyl-D-aspartate/D-glutamate deacylase